MTFDDILEIKNGRNQRTVENPEGKYPIYGSGGIMGYADDYICEADTVIVGRKGSINNPIFVDEPFWNVDTAFGLQAKREVLLPRYLFYFCKHFDFERLNKAVTIPSLTKSDLLKIELDLPDLKRQQKIVDKLLSVENIIKLRQSELHKLDGLVRARFVEMYGDPASNPMGWPETTVGNVCHYIKDGPHKSLPNIGQENGGHPFISVRNIVNHVIDFSTAKYISDEDYAEARKKCSPEKGDMLYSKGGTTGIAKLVDIDVEFANWVHLAVLKFDHSVLDGIFFENMLNCDYCYDQSQRLTKGIANRDLVLSAMAQIKIYRPPMVLQEQFAAFVAQVDKSKAVIQKSLDEMQLLFDSLMQQYFG